MSHLIMLDIRRLLGFRLAPRAVDLTVLTGAKVGKGGGGRPA